MVPKSARQDANCDFCGQICDEITRPNAISNFQDHLHQVLKQCGDMPRHTVKKTTFFGFLPCRDARSILSRGYKHQRQYPILLCKKCFKFHSKKSVILRLNLSILLIFQPKCTKNRRFVQLMYVWLYMRNSYKCCLANIHNLHVQLPCCKVSAVLMNVQLRQN